MGSKIKVVTPKRKPKVDPNQNQRMEMRPPPMGMKKDQPTGAIVRTRDLELWTSGIRYTPPKYHPIVRVGDLKDPISSYTPPKDEPKSDMAEKKDQSTRAMVNPQTKMVPRPTVINITPTGRIKNGFASAVRNSAFKIIQGMLKFFRWVISLYRNKENQGPFDREAEGLAAISRFHGVDVPSERIYYRYERHESVKGEPPYKF